MSSPCSKSWSHTGADICRFTPDGTTTNIATAARRSSKAISVAICRAFSTTRCCSIRTCWNSSSPRCQRAMSCSRLTIRLRRNGRLNTSATRRRSGKRRRMRFSGRTRRGCSRSPSDGAAESHCAAAAPYGRIVLLSQRMDFKMAEIEIVLHPIPTPDSKPYIIVFGPDQHLWFCESGTSKIGRLNPANGAFTEFATPTPDSRPIGITSAADGALWFCENAANKIGRITTSGAITEFALPTGGAGPDGIVAAPDGNVWFSDGHITHVGRITPGGTVTEFSQGLTPGCRPLSMGVGSSADWFSEDEADQI